MILCFSALRFSFRRLGEMYALGEDVPNCSQIDVIDNLSWLMRRLGPGLISSKSSLGALCFPSRLRYSRCSLCYLGEVSDGNTR